MIFGFIVKAFLVIFILVLTGFPQDSDITEETEKVPASSEKLRPAVVPKFQTAPVIDGRLDDEVWKRAVKFTGFVQTNPGDNIAPSKETVVYMGYDESNLYIGFMAFDEPDKIRSTVTKRDNLGGEDNVKVFLDTFDDQRRAYILAFNPLGIQADAIRGEDGRSIDYSVDVVMESKGVLLEDGYSVEVKIPFKSLRYAAGKDKFWGINFERNINRLNNEVNSWMPIKRGISELRQYGKITGLGEIKSERTLEIVPSITISESGERVRDAAIPLTMSRFVNRPLKTDIGVSLKYQISPNVTLDAAINPDFAEVEADAPVVRANERFPLFFPEKRPFFLEGIDYFRSPLQIVNTRNIADPDVAVKLTGKTGRTTFGILGAVDRFPNTEIKAFIGVLRLKRDLGANSNIGLFATEYHFGARRHNHLAGFDGKYQINQRRNLNFQVVGSHSRRFFYNPDTNTRDYRTGNGLAYQVNLDYTGRNRGWFSSINGKTRDYRADVGFTRRTNTHGANFGFRLGTEPAPDNYLIKTVARGFSGISFDETGRLQNADFNVRTGFDFQKQLEVSFRTGVRYEKVYEDEFGPRRNQFQSGAFFGEPERGAFQYSGEIGAGKTFSKRLSLGAQVGFTANALDLDFGASQKYPRVSPAYLQYLLDVRTNPNLRRPALDPGKAFNLNYQANANLQPTDPLSINLSYERTKLVRGDTDLTVFDANVFSLRSTYQFTRFTFARVRWDYETVNGTINGQALMGWNPSPGTAFYIGYNDNLLYRGYNEFNNQFDPAFRRDGRSFFIRASYLFRKSF